MDIATVTIRAKTWTVEVATTAAERSAGLSGRSELGSNLGMLFDMGSNQLEISINMDLMLFPLDIVFISDALLVQGMMWEVEPLEQNVVATFPEGPGARYFMEMNAEELGAITFDDVVTISDYTGNGATNGGTTVDVSSLVNLMITMMIIVMMMKMMTGAMGSMGDLIQK